MMRIIYSGSFGVVKIAQHVKTNTCVVLKIMMKYTVVSRSKTEYVMRERTILKQIRCPFIVLVYGTFQDNENLYIVEEFLQGGDMLRMLRYVRSFNVDLTRFYAAEIVCALSHLHLRSIIYRALKPENIALDGQGHLRLIDFGMAKRLRDGEKTMTLCGTPDYLAPEVILGEGHREPVDWWTLGILLYELLVGKPPFVDKSIPALYHKILTTEVTYAKQIDPIAEDLISLLLIKDQTQRIRLDEVKGHRFFEEIDWREVEKRKLEPLYVPRVTSLLDSSNFPFVEEIPKSQAFVENVDLFSGF